MQEPRRLPNNLFPQQGSQLEKSSGCLVFIKSNAISRKILHNLNILLRMIRQIASAPVGSHKIHSCAGVSANGEADNIRRWLDVFQVRFCHKAAAISFGNQLYFCGNVAGLQLHNGCDAAGFEE